MNITDMTDGELAMQLRASLAAVNVWAKALSERKYTVDIHLDGYPNDKWVWHFEYRPRVASIHKTVGL